MIANLFAHLVRALARLNLNRLDDLGGRETAVHLRNAFIGRYGKSDAAELMLPIHRFVAQANLQSCAAFVTKRRFRQEDRRAVLAPLVPGGRPARIRFSIDGIGDRKVAVRLFVVGPGTSELDRVPFLGIVRGCGLDLELGEHHVAVAAAAGSARGERFVRQSFQTECRERLRFDQGGDFVHFLGRILATDENRMVLQIRVCRAAVGLEGFGNEHLPFRIAGQLFAEARFPRALGLVHFPNRRVHDLRQDADAPV